MPSHHGPQRSHSFAGTTTTTANSSSTSSPFFSGYKLAPMGPVSNHPGGIVDDLTPISLTSSSLSLSGQHFPSSSSAFSHSQPPALYGGGGSWSGSSPSSSSSPSTPPYTSGFYGSEETTPNQNQQQQPDFVGASIGTGVRPISSFYRQNSLPTYLPPLQTSLTSSATSSTSSLTTPSSGLGDFSFTPSSTRTGSVSGSATSWFLDGLDSIPPPPATASSSYSTASSLSSSSSTPAPLSHHANGQEPTFFNYGSFDAFGPGAAAFSLGALGGGLNGSTVGGWGVGDKSAGAMSPIIDAGGGASPPTTMEPQMMFTQSRYAL